MQSKQQQQERIFQVTDGLRSKYTKRAYHLAFNQFLREAQRLKLDFKPNVVEQIVISYFEMLIDKGRVHKTIALHVAAILRFFVDLNDVPLNKRKITMFIPSDESSHRDKPLTLEDIRAILQAPDER